MSRIPFCNLCVQYVFYCLTRGHTDRTDKKDDQHSFRDNHFRVLHIIFSNQISYWDTVDLHSVIYPTIVPQILVMNNSISNSKYF